MAPKSKRISSPIHTHRTDVLATMLVYDISSNNTGIPENESCNASESELFLSLEC